MLTISLLKLKQIKSNASRKRFFLKLHFLYPYIMKQKFHKSWSKLTHKLPQQQLTRQVTKSSSIVHYRLTFDLLFNSIRYVESFQYSTLTKQISWSSRTAANTREFFKNFTQLNLFTYFGLSLKKLSKKLKPFQFFCFLFQLAVYAQVSLLAPTSTTIKYLRSTGSSGQLITLHWWTHTALIKLASTKKKYFSFYTILIPLKLAVVSKRPLIDTKAGESKRQGNRPIVRGIAKNPVDHPHGGRTKTIQYPQSPWGKLTKKNK